MATRSAKERVKAAFLLQKIAEKEDIKVSQEDLLNRITQLAQMSQTTPDKLIKDLQKRNGIQQLAGAQQKIGIARAAVSFIAHGERLVKKHAPRRHGGEAVCVATESPGSRFRIDGAHGEFHRGSVR